MNKAKTKTHTDKQSLMRAVDHAEIALSNRQIDPKAFAVWIRALLQNWRQGTVACKGRSDVSFSNRKPWKQKGTGRARAGSARSPLWRKGGVIFGPQARVRKLKIAHELRSGILNDLLYHAITRNNVICLDWTLNHELPKTALAHQLLRDAGIHKERVLLLLSPVDVLHHASFINIPSVQIAFFDQLNAYDLASADKVVVLKKDMDFFKQMVNLWN
ncbi:MAG: 50S ribosomal protein L4 [Candidatus Babeliales bacterium]